MFAVPATRSVPLAVLVTYQASAVRRRRTNLPRILSVVTKETVRCIA